jgi:hypothetical protein
MMQMAMTMTRQHGLEQAAERKARRLGWVKAGQCGGFVFHSEEFVDWQEATRSGQRVYRTFREALDSDEVAY